MSVFGYEFPEQFLKHQQFLDHEFPPMKKTVLEAATVLGLNGPLKNLKHIQRNYTIVHALWLLTAFAPKRNRRGNLALPEPGVFELARCR